MAFRRTVAKRAPTMQSSLAYQPQFHLFNHKTIIITSSNLNLPRKESNPTNNSSTLPLKSNLHRQLSSLNSPHPSNGDESSLTGSDVLMALQKAATLEKKKKKNKRRIERGEEVGVQEEELDHRNVRPISVKREWKERIDELEMRVLELKSQYHY